MQRLSGLTLLLSVLLAGCAHSPPEDPWDPIEPFNRAMFSFNSTMDAYVLRPVAVGYKKVTPKPVDSGVGNFFSNAYEPVTMVNSMLQLKWHDFNVSLGRFVINSTVGILGIFDVASAINIEDKDEDFGQTLGYWGVGQGPYLVLPFIGPSSGRDAFGLVGDAYATPFHYVDSWKTLALAYTLYFAHKRASYLAFDGVLEQQFDPYIFMREFYLKNREAAVQDKSGDDEDVNAGMLD